MVRVSNNSNNKPMGIFSMLPWDLPQDLVVPMAKDCDREAATNGP